MATADELRTQLAEARGEFRAALAGADSYWERQPAGGGEGEESWSPRKVAEHAIGAETYFTSAICKACGYPGVEPAKDTLPSVEEALQEFDRAVEATNGRLKHISEPDLKQPHPRFESVEGLLNTNIEHMRDHAVQIRDAAG